jgi:hypothetical protein
LILLNELGEGLAHVSQHREHLLDIGGLDRDLRCGESIRRDLIYDRVDVILDVGQGGHTLLNERV